MYGSGRSGHERDGPSRARIPERAARRCPMSMVAVSSHATLVRRGRSRRILRKIGFWFSVVVIVSPAILVFLWMLSLSLKNEIDNLAYPPVFIPSPPTLSNFVQVFKDNSMGLYFWNSVVVSGLGTLIALVVGIPAGYGIARAQAHKFTVLILIARMTPALSYLIPLFTVFQFLGLNNTLTSLVITHLVITVPVVVYIMIGYFETLPKELEEAAL